jgi:hypothetical protein
MCHLLFFTIFNICVYVQVLSVCSVQFKAVCDGMRSFRDDQPTTHKITIEVGTFSWL